MHLVIDSNQLQTDRLRRFFQQSQRNNAVITDFVAIEGYNGDLRGDLRWMEVLEEFPNQVVVLKGSAQIMKLSGRASGLVRRLIDDRVTQQLPRHLDAVRAARTGNPQVLNQVNELRKFAADHLSKMEQEATQIRASMDALGKMYTKEERTIVRERKPYSKEMLAKLTENLFSIVVMMVGPTARKRSFESDIKNTFMFRVAVAMYVLTLHRTAAGGLTEMKPSRLRNDMVDMILVAYGTFFDGVLTADELLTDLYYEVCVVLFGLYDAFIVEGCDPLSQLDV